MEPVERRFVHWDYMWRDRAGKKYVGMVLLPWERKREGRYLWEMKKRLADAHRTNTYVSITILQGDGFVDIDGRVAELSEEKSTLTIQDAAGQLYYVRLSDVLHIGSKDHTE